MNVPMRATARLSWLKFAPDGSAPRPKRFTVPAKFDHQGDDWRNDSWSLVVEHIRELNAREVQEVQVYFLMNDAPADWLTSGKRFILYDGREPLAEGVVL